MTARKPAIPIIRTKLHRPPVARDLVCRNTLHGRLEAEGLPPLPVLAGCVGNDLDDLEESLVLVLVDYHSAIIIAPGYSSL